MPENQSLIPAERIERSILLIRGQKVMLSHRFSIALRRGTAELIQTVKRNIERFPEDFMFQLNWEEFDILTSQTSTQPTVPQRYKITICDLCIWGGTGYRPYAFTEQGVAMLSSVLRSPQAVAVNIEIMRAFVRLRYMLSSHADLARRSKPWRRNTTASSRSCSTRCDN